MTARDERENRCVSLATVGDLDSLELVRAARPVPKSNEVIIAVSAAALNFKEVEQALGLSESADDGRASGALRFGLECAGTVVDRGDEVTEIAIGDEVVALGESCFSNLVAVKKDRVARIPKGWSFAEAAAFPIAFLTAYYALFRIGRLRKGESVLIHAATGGVGLAAVKLARRAGAEIFASAGTPEKRDYLRALGIAHVVDSRSLSFGDEIRAITRGRGVDVVLNSLSGELIGKGVQALAPYGRFLALGKRDVYAETPINLRWLEQGKSFSVIVFGADSPDFAELYAEVLNLCDRGELSPLPYRIFPAEEARAAFTYMARAAHTGKVLLAFRDDATQPRLERKSDPITEQPPVELAHALHTQDGVAAFVQALASGLPQVIVSTGPLQARQLDTLATQQSAASIAQPGPQRTFPRPAHAPAYVAPRSELEQTLCQLWQSFLGIAPVGIEDEFEALGGDSLLAAPLLTKLRTLLQVRLPTYQLLDTPTIAQLAQAITRQRSEAPTIAPLHPLLVELHAPDAQTPRPILFLVHPAGGHIHIYRDLAQALGADQPIYALQAQGLDGKSAPLRTIEELADSYIAAMRTVQPEGPYQVGGASLGGAISYEIGRRLHQQGQRVRFVWLGDTPGPNYMPPLLRDDAEILSYLLQLGGDDTLDADTLRRLSHDEMLQRYFESAQKNRLMPQQSAETLRAFLHVWTVHARALHEYAPEPSQVPVLYFLAREKDPWNARTPDRPWAALAQGGFDVCEAPGNHITMNYAPHVQTIAERLRKYLAAL